jgi:ABC-2 type transport system permease protein
VIDDEADAGVALPADAGQPADVYAENDDDRIVGVVRQALAAQSSTAALQAAGLSEEQIAAAFDVPAPQLEQVGEDHGGRVAAATVVSLTVYLLLFMVTAQVANGVAIEKANRVSEVLLAIAPPRSLLAGKVVGVGLVGLLPLGCGAVPVVVRLIAGGGLPPDTGLAVASGAAWFVLGAGLYLSAAGALGALVERQEEVGSAMASLSILLVGSYVIGQSAADTTLGQVLAILPFTSPMVEPARLALGVSSPAEVITSLAVSVVSLVLVVRLAAAIYERAVVRTGRRLHLRDVLRPAI